MADADRWLAYFRNDSTFDPDRSVHYLFVEARLARRRGAFEAADLFLARARAAPYAPLLRRMLLEEQLYLARDLDEQDDVSRLLDELDPADASAQVRYQRALALLAQDDGEAAAKVLREILASTDEEIARANCLGTLALVATSHAEAMRCYYEAIGLYLKLARVHDHAVVLSHLAQLEFYHGGVQQDSRRPSLDDRRVHPFRHPPGPCGGGVASRWDNATSS